MTRRRSGGFRRSPAERRPRRGFGLLVAAAAAAACVAAGLAIWVAARRERPAAGPIVLVSIDTLRADRLPIYGYRRGRTPAIDALARDAVVFERAYAHSPQTLPSHASIFTGRLPFEHGARDNLGFAVRPSERLLPQWLRERGYATAGVVSAYVLRKEVRLDQGFDFYDSALPVSSPELSFGQVQRDGAASLAVAERWLAERADPRWFLFLHLYEPHKPYSPPERYKDLEPYDGEIAYADEIVGRLLEHLRRRGLYDPATIVLLSDHGEGLGDHGELEHGVFVYNDTMHVPLVIKLPGGAGAGRRVGMPVQHVDLLPTLLELVGAPVPPGLPGRSLVPVLEDRGRVDERGIYAEALYPRYHFGWSELYSLTDARYRYIKAPREELYDLERDPGERKNLAAERPQVRAAMRAALDRLIAGRPVDTPAAASAEDRERLAALGYVGGQVEVAADATNLADPKDKIPTLRRYRAAVDLMGERRYGDAARLFREILAENPGMKDVWHQLANASVRAGDYPSALEAYRKLVEIGPTDPHALVGVAAVYLRLNRLDEARAHAELAARFASADDRRMVGSAYELLAKIALRQRDRDAALHYAARAEAADPTLPMAAYVQGRIAHAAGQYETALAFFLETARRLEGRTITLTELHYYTGDTLARLERPRAAEIEFRKELALFPENVDAWAGLAMLHRSQGRDAESAQAIDEMLKRVPTREGYAMAERLWRLFGEPARARATAAAAAAAGHKVGSE
jgi:choline-sulfatase